MEYFYLNQAQQQIGPCSLEELRQLMESGNLPPNTLVAHAGAAEWIELYSLIQSQPGPVAPSFVSPEAVNIPNYLAASIIVTILCCVPFGIVAILSACKVDKYIAVGDLTSADAASKNAKKWIIVSIVSAAVVGLLYMILSIAVR